MSGTVVIWPIMKAVMQAALYLQLSPALWSPINNMQETFLQDYFSARSELSLFNENELKTWVSRDHRELNTILKRENFTIQLDPFRPTEFGVVSILDVMVHWRYEGTRGAVLYHDKHYPAVSMDRGFKVYSSSFHNAPIVSIATKSDDVVWLTVADKPLKGFDLLEHIALKRMNLEVDATHYDSITFPMVDLNQEVNIKWLLGMQLQDWFISQASQQTKFKMNEKGAHVKSAVAIGVWPKCIDIKRRIVIDKPFYVWITRPGLSEPIFAGYIDPSDWKDPKNLEL